eukprot:TRINITY_DN20861_c0_g1_i1.p1 TRINITY_DN20861_c0_g1~~TRINITY_DN20861_c0_g1_i1.p1  ORF type:complete len:271 (+),score=132.73 TRINITY_DN20861_c0_g1_i1:43-855(+)
MGDSSDDERSAAPVADKAARGVRENVIYIQKTRGGKLARKRKEREEKREEEREAKRQKREEMLEARQKRRDAGEEEEEEEAEDGARVFLGNLPKSTSQEAVQKFVTDDVMKKVFSLKLARDKEKDFKGYAFITFKKKVDADAFVAERNGKYWRQGDEANERSRKVNCQISPFYTKKGQCFWCGSTEHMKDECTRNVKGFAGLSCYRCGKTGHILKDCPQVIEAKKRAKEREDEKEKRDAGYKAHREAGTWREGEMWFEGGKWVHYPNRSW